MSKSWDVGVLKKLKSLVGKGLSTSEIGKKLGISKNAVVGKLHRMGWNTGVTEAPVVKKKTATKPAAKVATKEHSKKIVKATAKVAVKKPAVKESVKKPVKAASKATNSKAKEVLENKEVKVAKKNLAKPATSKTKDSKKNLTVHQRIIQHSLEMMDLKPGQCRWPIGDPDSENFHFCGRPVFVGKPYCYEHCKQAYQFNAPKKKQ